MQKISLQIKKGIHQANNISIVNNNADNLILKIILWSFSLLAFSYLLILGNMVSNIIVRKNIESQIRILSNQVGDLELNYLSLSNNIDLSLSYAKGFKETKPYFATRKTLGFLPFDNIKNTQNDL